jgi:hypothetical protein
MRRLQVGEAFGVGSVLAVEEHEFVALVVGAAGRTGGVVVPHCDLHASGAVRSRAEDFEDAGSELARLQALELGVQLADGAQVVGDGLVVGETSRTG